MKFILSGINKGTYGLSGTPLVLNNLWNPNSLVSPSDLQQQGATDGQLLTWVAANSRYEPLSSPEWTDGGTFIYRDNPVVIGTNTITDSETTFQVNSKSTSASFPFIRIKANDGVTNLVTVLNNGNTAFSGRLSLNGGGFGHDGLLVKAFSDSSSSTIFGVNSTTNLSRFRISGDGTIQVVGRLLVNGASIQDGFSLRSFSDSALSSIFQLLNSTGGTNWFNVYGDGSVLVNGNFQFTDTRNIILGTATGTRIGSATNQKLGFWGKTPIIQPTTGVVGSIKTAVGGAAVNESDTFDGYTIGQVVRALRNTGLLA